MCSHRYHAAGMVLVSVGCASASRDTAESSVKPASLERWALSVVHVGLGCDWLPTVQQWVLPSMLGSNDCALFGSTYIEQLFQYLAMGLTLLCVMPGQCQWDNCHSV